MKKFLAISAVALFAVVLGQNITHASTDSLTWTYDNTVECPTSNNGVFTESDYFYHNNEWVYADITNTGKTENTSLQYFCADVKGGTDDGFYYTADKKTNIITGVEDYGLRYDGHYEGRKSEDAYEQLTGHKYLAPGETAHFKLKVAATSGMYNITATKVRGVYYGFYHQDAWSGDHTKLNVHFWTNNEGWDGSFDVRG